MVIIRTRRTNTYGFCPVEVGVHHRKYTMIGRVRSRAHEFVGYSWNHACRDADVRMRRLGASLHPDEDTDPRYAKLLRGMPSEGSRWMACEALGLPRVLLRRRPINEQQHRYKLGGFDPALMRRKCAQFGKRCESPLVSSPSFLPAATDAPDTVHVR
jgi:hypothetical protein